jgi:hypothetical protein
LWVGEDEERDAAGEEGAGGDVREPVGVAWLPAVKPAD